MLFRYSYWCLAKLVCFYLFFHSSLDHWIICTKLLTKSCQYTRCYILYGGFTIFYIFFFDVAELFLVLNYLDFFPLNFVSLLKLLIPYRYMPLFIALVTTLTSSWSWCNTVDVMIFIKMWVWLIVETNNTGKFWGKISSYRMILLLQC